MPRRFFILVSRALRARLGAARIAMEHRDGPALEAISKTQADAVVDLAKRDQEALLALSPEEKASLVDLAVDGEVASRRFAQGFEFAGGIAAKSPQG